MGNLLNHILSYTMKILFLIGIIYGISLIFRKKEIIQIERKPKTRNRVILEIAGWVFLSITSILYTVINSPNSILMYFVISFWLTLLAFYVYDDSRKRYINQLWNIGWAVAVFVFFPIFLYYLFSRPPVAFEITGTRFRKKILFPCVIVLLFFILVIIFASPDNNKKAYKAIRSGVTKAGSSLNNLPQEEQDRFYEFKEKINQIICNHLDEQDKGVYNNLMNKGTLTDADLDTSHMLLQKVNPNLTEEEKTIIKDFQKFKAKLTGFKSQ